MKNIIGSIIGAVTAISLGVLLFGCRGGGGIEDALIQSGTSVGVSTYLKNGVCPGEVQCARRTAIANIGDEVATIIRSATTNPPPTPDQLSQLIITNLPQTLKDQYPEVIAFIIPLVVQGYQFAIQQYGGANQQGAYQILNDIAIGVENGCALYIHH